MAWSVCSSGWGEGGLDQGEAGMAGLVLFLCQLLDPTLATGK